MIDVEGFRRVNQEYGNLVGDLVLKEFARELRSSCRLSDLVARWGGDVFIVVLDCPGRRREAANRTFGLVDFRPYQVPGRSGHVSVRLAASIGVAEYREGDNLQEILERADAALCAQQELTRKRRAPERTSEHGRRQSPVDALIRASRDFLYPPSHLSIHRSICRDRAHRSSILKTLIDFSPLPILSSLSSRANRGEVSAG